MKIKTSELTGTALDWAVQWAHNPTGPTGAGWYERDANNKLFDPLNEYTISPSTDWAQGGPIIERGHIHTWTDRKDAAYAGHPDSYWVAEMTELGGIWWGPTPLIAAMRCYVANRLGDEIDIPKELT